MKGSAIGIIGVRQKNQESLHRGGSGPAESCRMNMNAIDEWAWAREGEGHRRQREEHVERHRGLKLYQAFYKLQMFKGRRLRELRWEGRFEGDHTGYCAPCVGK